VIVKSELLDRADNRYRLLTDVFDTQTAARDLSDSVEEFLNEERRRIYQKSGDELTADDEEHLHKTAMFRKDQLLRLFDLIQQLGAIADKVADETGWSTSAIVMANIRNDVLKERREIEAERQQLELLLRDSQRFDEFMKRYNDGPSEQ
jgi:hypothetical protein